MFEVSGGRRKCIELARKLNADNDSDQIVTICKGKTKAAQEAVMRIVSGLMASETALLTSMTMHADCPEKL